MTDFRRIIMLLPLVLFFAVRPLLAPGAGDSPATGGEGNKTSSQRGTATLIWDPVTDASGKEPKILAGYKIHYGRASRSYTRTIDVGKKTRYTIHGLTAGTYFFSVTAYDRDGNESPYSDEVKKRLR